MIWRWSIDGNSNGSSANKPENASQDDFELLSELNFLFYTRIFTDYALELLSSIIEESWELSAQLHKGIGLCNLMVGSMRSNPWKIFLSQCRRIQILEATFLSKLATTARIISYANSAGCFLFVRVIGSKINKYLIKNSLDLN